MYEKLRSKMPCTASVAGYWLVQAVRLTYRGKHSLHKLDFLGTILLLLRRNHDLAAKPSLHAIFFLFAYFLILRRMGKK